MQIRRTLFGVVPCLVPGLAAAQIDLELTASPDPVHPNETLEVVLLASNTSAVPQADLTAELTLPLDLNALAENLISDAGGCAGTACEAGEVVSWTLGTLAPARGDGHGGRHAPLLSRRAS